MGTVNYREGHFRHTTAKIRLEQNIDSFLRNRRATIEGEPFDESPFTEDNRFHYYQQNMPYP